MYDYIVCLFYKLYSIYNTGVGAAWLSIQERNIGLMVMVKRPDFYMTINITNRARKKLRTAQDLQFCVHIVIEKNLNNQSNNQNHGEFIQGNIV